MEINIYHGSLDIIKNPEYGLGKIHNDYGRGFYCTENKELAKEWAVGNSTDGFANHYKLNMDGLNVLNLSGREFSVLNWIAILVKNRQFVLKNDITKCGKEFLLENYLIDISSYDIIKGYRADDSYFDYAVSFLNNSLSLEQLTEALRLGNLGTQIVLVSEKAFSQLKFVDFETAPASKYYAMRKRRNEQAKSDYKEMIKKSDVIHGTYLFDVIRGGEIK